MAVNAHGLDSRLAARACLVLFLGSSLLAAALPLQADEAAANTLGGRTVQWMSGGVGEDARAEMQRSAAGYNVHVLFSDRSGHYMAAIPFALQRPDGREIQSGVSDGPFLYLRLAPGKYRLEVELAGVRQSRPFTVAAGQRPVQLNFVGPER